MREGATDNGQITAANERRMGKNDTGTKEGVEEKERVDERAVSKAVGRDGVETSHGRTEEILRMDGFRGGRELSDRGEQEADSGNSGQHLGEQFISYVRKLRDNAKVLVRTYRTETLEKAGKDAGLSFITKERGDK